MAKVTALEGKIPRLAPQRQIVSVENSDLFLNSRFERYNPDALAQRKGGLGVYARMMTDDQVKAVVRFKQLSIMGRGYQFVFEGAELPEEEQLKRVTVMDAMVRTARGSFSDTLMSTLRAYQNGYSLQEIITDTITVDGAQYVGINKIVPRDVAGFQFYTDEFGELRKFTQKIGRTETELDYSKFLHFVVNPDEDAWYGQSELRAAYRPWFMKETAIKFWMCWLERMAGGFAAISLGESGINFDSPEYRALQGVLSNMRSAMGIILPTGATMELVTPSTTDAYQKAVEFHDLAIAKSLLIPNLLGLSNSGQTGAYAQSQTQLEVYFTTIAADVQRLEQTLNDQLFGPIARQNWDDGQFPRFKFKTANGEQIKWMVETFQKLVSGNVAIATESDEAWLRKLLDAPERDPDDAPLVTPQQEHDRKMAEEVAKQPTVVAPAADKKNFEFNPDQERDEDGKWTGGGSAAIKSLKAEAEGDIHDEMHPLRGEAYAVPGKASKVIHGKTITAYAQPTPGAGGKQSSVRYNLDGKAISAAKLAAWIDNPEGDSKKFSARYRALARVDFSVIAQRTRALEDDTAQSIAKLSARAISRTIADERLKELLDKDTADIGEMKIDPGHIGKIKAAFRQTLERAWSMGLMQAMDETSKARKQAYADEARKIKFVDLRNRASDYFDSNAFRMAGNLTDTMRGIIQSELLSATRSGVRPEQAAATIYERLIRKGITTLEAMQIEEPREEVRALAEEALADALDTANVPAYLNTLTRTNTFEALNEARYAEFTDPAVADFVEALEFSSILDDRTTDICTAMDGHIHGVNSAVWNSHRPPLHYNCRSVLIAVTTLDGWDGVESEEPTVEPQDGF